MKFTFFSVPALLAGSVLAQTTVFVENTRICQANRLLRALTPEQAESGDILQALAFCSSYVYERRRTTTITQSVQLPGATTETTTVTTSSTTLPTSSVTVTTYSSSTSTSTTSATTAYPTVGCGRVHTVSLTDSCYTIYSQYGITFDLLRQYNPFIGPFCAELTVGQVLCVSVLVGATNPTSTSITTTTTSTTTTTLTPSTQTVPTFAKAKREEATAAACPARATAAAPAGVAIAWRGAPPSRLRGACRCLLYRDVQVQAQDTVIVTPTAVRASAIVTVDAFTSSSTQFILVLQYSTITVTTSQAITVTPATSFYTSTSTQVSVSTSIIPFPLQVDFRPFECRQDLGITLFSECCAGVGLVGELMVGINCNYNLDILTPATCDATRPVPLCCQELPVSCIPDECAKENKYADSMGLQHTARPRPSQRRNLYTRDCVAYPALIASRSDKKKVIHLSSTPFFAICVFFFPSLLSGGLGISVLGEKR
ncbi:hypothetical protein QBC35DRAFT_438828 [Podospora australis]|uniref:LysM domain-containing protein n=1 Tax=Podospora australis TaxID=1536484 RepID=A0AAN6WPM9_9PEZI|nr:hypothetical protein QBC35DRAFT_438828 [Podospora australis]